MEATTQGRLLAQAATQVETRETCHWFTARNGELARIANDVSSSLLALFKCMVEVASPIRVDA
jgi:hypothetical protein